MIKDSNPDTRSSISPRGGTARIDWNYPLVMSTTGLVLMGVSALFRLLPIPEEYAYLLTIIVLVAWRYGIHRAGILPWHWRGSMNYSFFSFKQALLNGMGFFVFMLAVFTWRGSRPTLSSAVAAAIGGLLFGLLDVNSKASSSNSHPQNANS